MYDVDWDKEGISSRKLEYIAYKFGFFYEGHRAINDCLAGVHLLAQKLPKSQVPVLKELLTQSAAIRFKLYAVNSPYDSKELLKARGYRWSMNQNPKYRAWSIELNEDKVAEEINYLRSSIYSTSSINIPVEILDAHSRFSSTKRLIKPTSGFKSMRTAYATVKGFEVMRMFKKGRFNFWKYGQGIFGEIRIITDNLLAC